MPHLTPHLPHHDPNQFPGEEFSHVYRDHKTVGYEYEVNSIQYVHTALGDLLALPEIDYHIRLETGGKVYDNPTNKIDVALLDESQKEAVHKAAVIEHVRQEYPTLDAWPHLRKVKATGAGLLYICAPKEGFTRIIEEPYAALKTVKPLGVVDFATPIRGYYTSFRYNEADIEEFIGTEMIDADAYAFISKARTIFDDEGNYDHKYQIAKLMLFATETDMAYPLARLQAEIARPVTGL